ncbi:Tripartite-type tricarboxylate transporter, receptor component TctC [Polaromonas sp. OV174]|uniref:Bug family tripartite tricarboxylate transporter substrate binding protein n=1 Tax=Polaromonas sp. OV174 TaxID=1855300 RepID=UPI0008E37685|nr:tripartite tricarboxylate transporter substrate binding protein [Polaromonas sp. OV174]SFB90439.1 Tripartite-type tricarboxylate transporter, receptor component TctC [Polaromonas sp. OV174]
MIHRRTFLAAASAASIATLAAPSAWAQPTNAWPQRPIRLVVPFPPGGSADFLGRMLAEKITTATGWVLVVENRAGAAGNIGLDAVAKALPDGYTFGIGQTANLAINPSLYAKMPFDPLKDLTPIALVASQPMVVTVKAESPFRTLNDLVAEAKKRREPMRVAFAGNGTVGHLTIELLERRAGIELLNVPYKGAGPAVNDLRAGHVDFYIGNSISVLGQVKGGSLRALAVTSPTRLQALAEVPTVAESGFTNFDAQTWSGLVAPTGVPSAILERMYAEVSRVLTRPEVLAKFAAEGSSAATGRSTQQFAELIRSEHRSWGELVRQAKIQIE